MFGVKDTSSAQKSILGIQIKIHNIQNISIAYNEDPRLKRNIFVIQESSSTYKNLSRHSRIIHYIHNSSMAHNNHPRHKRNLIQEASLAI
jgi:5'(3')-deoxyribonucleotidase